VAQQSQRGSNVVRVSFKRKGGFTILYGSRSSLGKQPHQSAKGSVKIGASDQAEAFLAGKAMNGKKLEASNLRDRELRRIHIEGNRGAGIISQRPTS